MTQDVEIDQNVEQAMMWLGYGFGTIKIINHLSQYESICILGAVIQRS
jgi:hypothetical protein